MTMGISGACTAHGRKQKSMQQEKQRKKEPGTGLSERVQFVPWLQCRTE